MTLPIWHYVIDSEGHVWHEGVEFDDSELLHFFMENMERSSDGTYRVICQGEECRLTAEDVPYVVQKIEETSKRMNLVFPGEYKEPLDPSTLSVGSKNVLYCQVRHGQFRARFNRTSYLDLTKKIKHDKKSKRFYLTIDKKKYFIQGVTA